MLIAILATSTALTVSWLLLLGRAVRDDWVAAAYSKVFDNIILIEKLRAKNMLREKKLSRYHGIAAAGMKMLFKGNPEKKITKLEHINRCVQNGDISKISIFSIPGYVLQREFEAIGKGNIHKTIMEMSFEIYGKKHVAYKTKQLLAKLLSYPIIGVALTLALGGVVLGMGNMSAGTGILGIGTVLVLVLTYAMYDELSDSVKKRRNEISRQFPNVVSKLALLVTSGMIMDRAWKETAYSQENELYKEMRKTSEELDNLVSPEAAYIIHRAL